MMKNKKTVTVTETEESFDYENDLRECIGFAAPSEHDIEDELSNLSGFNEFMDSSSRCDDGAYMDF